MEEILVEIWDLYDKNRNVIGEHIRGNELPSNGYHLVVHVWIKNNKGEYLISQRAASRPTHPLEWECVGGSVLKGESSLQGAIRETKEEVGIEIDETMGHLVYTKIRDTINGNKFNDICDVWLFEYNGTVDLSNATTDEVAQTRWMTREQIEKYFEDGKMVKSIKDLFYFVKDVNCF